MIKHIVTWQLKEEAHGNDKATNAQKIKAMLEALRGKMVGMPHLEVGIDFSKTQASYDVLLYSEFVDRAALEAYQVHPEHMAVKSFIGEATATRVLVDYEV
jgi:Stress responsive A/B Barrel Domain